MALYAEVGEETKEENKEDWVGEKREASTKVQVKMERKNSKIQKRKKELDAAKKKDGSIIKTVCPPPENEKRGAKRPRPTLTKKKEDDPKQYVGQRIAKYFDDPTPENPNQQVIYFGTIDKVDKDNSFWHVRYDDDDDEEFDFREIRAGILFYAKNKKDDPNR